MCTTTRDNLSPEMLASVVKVEDKTKCEILEIGETDDGIFPTLINGRPIDRDEWLEVVRIGNRSCTATMVGPRVAVTAAHCGRNNSRTNVEVYNLGTFPGRMIHMPQYRNGSNYDLAVIVLDAPIDIPFASVDMEYQFTKGKDVDIAGYGCVRPGGGGGNDGILRWGESKITGTTGTDVITRWRPNGGALCFGDSGGPMFADGSNTGEIRKLIAVNSKGNIRDTNYNMRLDWDAVRDFFQSIVSRYSVEIYGFNATNPGDPEPEPEPPKPEDPPQPGDPTWKQYQIKLLENQENFFRSEREKLEATIGQDGGDTGSDDDGGPILFDL